MMDCAEVQCMRRETALKLARSEHAQRLLSAVHDAFLTRFWPANPPRVGDFTSKSREGTSTQKGVTKRRRTLCSAQGPRSNVCVRTWA